MTDSRAALVGECVELSRQYRMLVKTTTSLTLQIKAICRRACQGDKADAKVLFEAVNGKGEHGLLVLAAASASPFLLAMPHITEPRAETQKRLEQLAKDSPLAAFQSETRGLGFLNCALLFGECGDLSNYATKERVWKRMGLAVMPDGKRQRRVKGDAAVEHGYVAERHAVAWNIGAQVFKHQSERVDKETGEITREAGPYRLFYDKEKARQLEKELTKGHAHNRALRHMTKLLIADMWRAWRVAE